MYPYKILLVEDEPTIACYLKIELEKLGFDVLQAANSSDALDLCPTHFPDFAILNFNYPNSPDGMWLARQLRIRFLVKIIFISGARPQDLSSSPDHYGGHDVLYKPYTQQQFLQFCKRCLP